MILEPDLELCILGILQRAITEARSMTLAGEGNKTADLLDSLDNIPRHLANWSESSMQEIHEQLSVFMKKYSDHYTDYVKVIESGESLI